MSEEDFKAFQKQNKKNKILLELTSREDSYPTELAKMTKSTVDETEQLLDELVSEKLVDKIVGKYYKLTYEGYRRAKELLARKQQW